MPVASQPRPASQLANRAKAWINSNTSIRLALRVRLSSNAWPYRCDFKSRNELSICIRRAYNATICRGVISAEAGIGHKDGRHVLRQDCLQPFEEAALGLRRPLFAPRMNLFQQGQGAAADQLKGTEAIKPLYYLRPHGCDQSGRSRLSNA